MYDRESIRKIIKENQELKDKVSNLDNQIKSMHHKVSNLEEEKMALYQENQRLKGA